MDVGGAARGGDMLSGMRSVLSPVGDVDPFVSL